jgi:tight adherence protein B
MTTSEALAALAGAGCGLGLVLVLAGLLPRDTLDLDPPPGPLLPGSSRSGPALSGRTRLRGLFARAEGQMRVRDARWWRRVVAMVVAAALAGWWTGWPVAAALAAASLWWLPRMLGPDRALAETVAKIEAVAGWAEQLRDTLTAASGLEQAIAATARAAPAQVRPAVVALAARIRAGERLPVALAQAGRDLADPTADLVIAALMMAARQQARQLAELLSALASAARAEAAGRLRTAAARARVRTSMRVIVGATVGLAAVLTMFNSAYLAPYGTVEGQIFLAAIGALFACAFAWMARIARPQPAPRLLPEEVDQ